MKKKCINGIICMKNTTLILMIIILLCLSYIFFYKKIDYSPQGIPPHSQSINEQSSVTVMLPKPISSRRDPFNDPYAPPLKNADGLIYPVIYPRDVGDIRGIPINIETQGLATQYEQIGILERLGTNGSTKNDMILPLMGRRTIIGRDKWQYYTISNTGTLNTKLPVLFKGRSCTSENGCDNITCGDIVFVKGYNDSFKATIYENNNLQYIPF
jgi:hypothetical protein